MADLSRRVPVRARHNKRLDVTTRVWMATCLAHLPGDAFEQVVGFSMVREDPASLTRWLAGQANALPAANRAELVEALLPVADEPEDRPAALALFDFEGHQIRPVVEDDGSLWLRAAEVARAWGYSEARKLSRLVRRHADDFIEGQDRRVVPASSLGPTSGPNRGSVLLLSESGVYMAALLARTDAARRFRRWLTDEVLPALSRKGHYVARRMDAATVRKARRLLARGMAAAKVAERLSVTEGQIVRLARGETYRSVG